MTKPEIISQNPDYQSKKNTPIGEHIDRVGVVFYER
jgi:hypothetical protein